jgi:hypothetical protein
MTNPMYSEMSQQLPHKIRIKLVNTKYTLIVTVEEKEVVGFLKVLEHI